MKTDKMSQAQSIRYGKIERLTELLCRDNSVPLDYSAMGSLDKPFKVGKRIIVDGQNVSINKKTYCAYDIKKVTINTEGSLSIYSRSGKKLCGWSVLNLSTEKIELFCLWARRNGILSESVSGGSEKAFQLVFLSAVIILVVLIKLLHTVV